MTTMTPPPIEGVRLSPRARATIHLTKIAMGRAPTACSRLTINAFGMPSVACFAATNHRAGFALNLEFGQMCSLASPKTSRHSRYNLAHATNMFADKFRSEVTSPAGVR